MVPEEDSHRPFNILKRKNILDWNMREAPGKAPRSLSAIWMSRSTQQVAAKCIHVSHIKSLRGNAT